MAVVQNAQPAPGGMAPASECHARKAVKLSSHQVAKRVAGQGVSRKQDHVDEQNEGPHSHPDMSVEKESAERVMP